MLFLYEGTDMFDREGEIVIVIDCSINESMKGLTC